MMRLLGQGGNLMMKRRQTLFSFPEQEAKKKRSRLVLFKSEQIGQEAKKQKSKEAKLQ